MIKRRARQVTFDGRNIHLSEQLFTLLLFLAERARESPATVEIRDIEDHVWGASIHRISSSIREPIRALRSALKEATGSDLAGRRLIEYRRKHDHLVECISNAPFHSDYGGDWIAKTYRNKVDGTVHIVLQKGQVLTGQPTLVRMHGISIFSDVLGQPGPRKRILQRAMAEIGREGAGVIVLLMPTTPGELSAEVGGADGPAMDLRSYGLGAQILTDLGVQDMVLLTNSHRNIVAIEGHGINIVGERPIPEN